jgi:hypothetical protein
VEQLHKALFGYFFPPWKKYHSTSLAVTQTERLGELL